ncbi:hypothetical protein BH11BAC3_BH11BAC3_32410 [soil metagenome]
MKTLSVIAIAAIVCCFTACKKNDTPAPVIVPVVVPKVKTVSSTANGVVEAPSLNEYDSMGRLIKITYSDGAYCTFNYAAQVVTNDCYNAANAFVVKTTYGLNAQGLVATAVTSNSSTVTTEFKFDGTRQMASQVTKDKGLVTSANYFEYDHSGNRIKDSLVTINGAYINTYDYYLDKISTTEQINFGRSIFGTGNKNCLKRIILKDIQGNTTVSTYSVPQTDAAGRISTTEFDYNGSVVTTTFTYY